MSMRTGSCHCRTIRYVCEPDSPGGAVNCECRFCSKRHPGSVFMTKNFRLVAGDTALSVYELKDADCVLGSCQHFFCSHCGTHIVSRSCGKSLSHAVSVMNLDPLPQQANDIHETARPLLYGNI